LLFVLSGKHTYSLIIGYGQELVMKFLKIILLSLLIGVGVGMWLGVNIGREVPLYSNPFDTDSLNQKLKKATSETLDKGGQALEKTGQALEKTGQAMQDKLDK